MSALVHLAAQPIRAGAIIRQRCAWCGALIEEIDLTHGVAVPEGQEPPRFVDDGNPTARWEGLVAVEEHGEGSAVGLRAKWSVDDPADGKIPDDSCMALEPAVTA